VRWTDTCDLVAKEHFLDSEGVPQAVDVVSTVFCNERSLGRNTWSSMYEIGISQVAELEVMSCDYDGQLDVVYKDVWYSVEKPDKKGDRTILVLRHQQSDSADAAESAESGDANG